MPYSLIFVLLLLLVPCAGRAVEISEVCSNNVTAYATRSGDCPDWIELYNPDDAPVDLSDYWISNDADHPLLHSLEGCSIEAHGHLLLCADKRELPFKLSASGCAVLLTKDGDGESAAVSVPPLACDETYSRQADGDWHITSATPLAANAEGHAYQAPVYVAAPVFSAETGFYADEFALEISCGAQNVIYYTTDGSIPDENARRYDGAFPIGNRSYAQNVYSAYTDISFDPVTKPDTLLNKATVVRAVAVDAQGNRSKVVTNTYLVGLSDVASLRDISVLSIVADPDDLFDRNDGIYKLGRTYREWLEEITATQGAAAAAAVAVDKRPANFNLRGRLNEVPVSVQWLDENGILRLNQDMGLRIRGNYSRAAANKSFQLYARGEYGGGSIAYPFWADAGKADQLVVRNGGNDQTLLFRDVFAHTLLEPLGLPISRAIPCVAFVDGEYWGLYNIREKQNADYIAERCGVYADEVILIKNRELDEGYADELSLYTDFVKAIAKLDCSLEADYAAACELMDMDNYVTYMAAALYIQCTDWINFNGNNISLWRTRSRGPQENADTRWRWFFQDLDHSSGWGAADPTPVESLLYESTFSSLWESPDFRTLFLTRVMNVANITCDMDRVNAILDDCVSRYRDYALLNFHRFGYAYTLSDFDEKVKGIRRFYRQRPEEIAEQLTDALRLDNALYTLTVASKNPFTPTVLLDGQAIPFAKDEWSGLYFSACPIALTAADAVGYDFTGWYEDGRLLSSENTLKIELSANRTLTPVYAQKAFAVILNGENSPETSADGAIALQTGSYLLSAELRADDGLSACTDAGAVVLTPESGWSKRLGATVRFDTAGYTNLTVDLTLSLDEDAPEQWRLLYSTDGDSFEVLSEEPLDEGGGALRVALPDELGDQYDVYLRLEAAKKSFGGGGPRVALNGLCVSGEAIDVSLAALDRCMDLCQRRMGADFERPDAKSLENLSAEEVERRAADLYARLAAWIVKGNLSVVAPSDVASLPALEGTEGQPLFEIPSEIGEYVSEVAVDVGWEGTAYLYRLSEDGLADQGVREILGGQARVPAIAGRYALLDRPVSAFRYRVDFTRDAIDEALAQRVFSRKAPDSYLWLELSLLTEYQEGVAFAPPAESELASRDLYLYAEADGALCEVARLTPDANGVFAADALKAGRYLALDEPLSFYQRYETPSPDAASETDAGDSSSGGLLRVAAPALALAVSAVAVLALVRKRRRKKRAK